MTNGIDVSKHNGVINWSAVKVSGKVDFAILRAGYGKVISQKDAKFEANYQGCADNGIPCGAYWYCYATTVEEARQEAKICLEVLKNKKFDFPIYYDIEENSTFKTGINNVSKIAETFCTELENAGYFAGIYAAKSHLDSYFTESVKKRFTVWVAHVGVQNTNYSGTYGMWQYSWKGAVPGISGDVDLDHCYRDFPGEISKLELNGFEKQDNSAPTAENIPQVEKSEMEISLTVDGKKYTGVLKEE